MNIDPPWSADEIAALRDALVQQRMSAGQAAAHLTAMFRRNFTRNMVIGKAKRLGIEMRGGAPAWRASMDARMAKRLASASPAPKPRPSRAKGVAPAPSGAAVVAFNADWRPRRLSLLELKVGDCRYPLGDPRDDDFAFCGAPAPIDKPYCPHCARLAYDSQADRAEARKKYREARGMPA
ncbi:MAG: hypothetical protein FJX06_19280 [Alphaproteobacteria bacterium]|nr:hypothetical protein [Alphaproteobacteria bacterium]